MSETTTGVVEELARALGERVFRDEATRAAHRADSWMLSELRDFQGRAGPLPQAVVRAGGVEDVATCLRICREARTPVVTYGGGSGVCGAIQVTAETIVLATREMSGLVELDSDDLRATFRAGTMGNEAEARVQQDGLTIGHWPQSIDLSTVGGWVATRASGQYSTAYGSIEDMVLALEAVLPDGRILRTRDTPRASAGPDLRHLLFGSEGTLGVVTEVTFSLRSLPELQAKRAFHFESLRTGLEAIRQLMRAGWRPPVVRLYDAQESQRHFGDHCPDGRAMLILLHEGPVAAVSAEVEGVAALCRAVGGEQTDSSAVDLWFEKRNHVASFRTFLEGGLIVDTIEVAATWSRVGELYDRVTRSLLELPDVRVATAHSSHSYRSGTNLYFSFAAKPDDPERMEEVYTECWRRTMVAAGECGAGIAHHHGIGRVRRDFLEAEIGSSGVGLLRSVKRALDPDGLLNPGALLPPGPS